jgi:hypothetical protein
LKSFALLLVIVALSACSKPAESGAAAAAKDPFVQKLNSLPESERAEYARTHAEEAMRSAGTTPK